MEIKLQWTWITFYFNDFTISIDFNAHWVQGFPTMTEGRAHVAHEEVGFLCFASRLGRDHGDGDIKPQGKCLNTIWI
jgi:hypothetical protein